MISESRKHGRGELFWQTTTSIYTFEKKFMQRNPIFIQQRYFLSIDRN
jgi:hypothetical protein